MSCIIKDCHEEAHLPYFACSQEHGFRWNQIKQALQNGTTAYLASPFHSFQKHLTPDEVNYYKGKI